MNADPPFDDGQHICPKENPSPYRSARRGITGVLPTGNFQTPGSSIGYSNTLAHPKLFRADKTTIRLLEINTIPRPTQPIPCGLPLLLSTRHPTPHYRTVSIKPKHSTSPFLLSVLWENLVASSTLKGQLLLTSRARITRSSQRPHY